MIRMNIKAFGRGMAGAWKCVKMAFGGLFTYGPHHVQQVPCDGCFECCRNEAIFIHPEHGDKAKHYVTAPYDDGRLILAHQKNGDCIYLNRKEGCTIYRKRPSICRSLDCRDLLKVPRKIRKRAISNRVLAAAKRLPKKEGALI